MAMISSPTLKMQRRPHRTAGLVLRGVAAALVLGASISISTDGGLQFGWLAVVFPVAMILVGLSLLESYEVVAADEPPSGATFMELPPEVRRRALDLAWMRPLQRASGPIEPFFGASGEAWLLPTGAAALAGAALAAVLHASPPRYESFEWASFATVAALGFLVLMGGDRRKRRRRKE